MVDLDALVDDFIARVHHHRGQRPPPRHRRIRGRFEGAQFFNPKTGEIEVAIQTVPSSTALTGALIFTDQTGATVAGPIGTIASDQPTVSPSLSADGQHYNFTSPPSGDVTLTWSDPAGKVASFSQTFTDQVVEVITGAFGQATAGTTP